MSKKLELIEKGFKCQVDFSPAFDKRHTDPSKNYGIHGVNMRFVLTGEKGASQFLVYTNWHLPSVSKEGWSDFMLEPMGADVGYHAKSPQYEG